MSSQGLPDDTYHSALLSAWRQFINFDAASGEQKNTRTRIRSRIIWLGVITSFVAVSVSIVVQPEGRFNGVDASTLHGMIYNLYADHWRLYKTFLQIVLAILPLLTTGFIAYASDFSPTLAWAVYRIGAEMIRREIYLYRTDADPYGQLKTVPEKAAKLTEHVKLASQLEKVYPTDQMDNSVQRDYIKQTLSGSSAIPFVQQIGREDGTDILDKIRATTDSSYHTLPPPTKWEQKLLLYTLKSVQYILRPLSALYRFMRYQISRLGYKAPPEDKTTTAASDKADIDHSKPATITTEMPKPNLQAVEDDGFSPLTHQQYVEFRLVPQLNWYSARVQSDYYSLRVRKIVILFFGALGSLLVALSLSIPDLHLEAWVAVTSALVTALGLMIELKMFTHTYLIYNNTAQNLLALYSEWQSLLKNGIVVEVPKVNLTDAGRDAATDGTATASVQPSAPIHDQTLENARKSFIVRTEAYLQKEREEWMTRVIQSQTALEQKLAKSEGQSNNDKDNVARQGTPYLLKTLGDSARLERDFDRAQILYQESLRLYKKDGNYIGILGVLESIVLLSSAEIALKTGNQEANAKRVAKLYGSIEKNSQAYNFKTEQNATQYEMAIKDARLQIPNDEFEKLQKEGETATLDTIISEAMTAIPRAA